MDITHFNGQFVAYFVSIMNDPAMNIYVNTDVEMGFHFSLVNT
jgi:hypothetical protein